MITIIGNGESRKDINISKIKSIKLGCNAIYLHEKVDYICAMDKFWRDKIIKETSVPLISRKINNAFQMYLQIYRNGKWEDTNCPYRGYLSGTTGLDYMCSIFPKEEIYLIGFDFGYSGKSVNHIYKDTKFHPKSNRKAQNQNICEKQTVEIKQRYPRTKIYWVTDSDFNFKLNKVSIEKYKEIAYVELD